MYSNSWVPHFKTSYGRVKMGNTLNSNGKNTGNNVVNFKPSDIKSLVQGQGRATIGERECVLKYPAVTDQKLQQIVNNPSFSAKPVGATPNHGEWEYELSAQGQTVNIKFEATKRAS